MPAHVVTQVDGVVKDIETGLPLQGVPVWILGEGGPNFYGQRWHLLPAKDTTDANGRFSIRFASDGESKSFKASTMFNSDPRFYNGSEASLKTRKYNVVELTARTSKVLRLNLKVQQNPYDTLVLTSGFLRDSIAGRRVDTALFTWYQPPSVTMVHVWVLDPVAGRHRNYFDYLRPPDPVQDTLTVDITIPNTADLPFNP
ncbi:hypothetical protein ACFOTA_07675 [Chitinophaga sp. GCM10012297]|uniref:Carboxypeptidase regulatory-like domain-containing protein n=1 Tax=Chitinophaga chungangae TaxID=2821488 RepID=A0ABS3YBQ2_9BACT|nr:hypothetical protein [Chitinophaga chungangae]